MTNGPAGRPLVELVAASKVYGSGAAAVRALDRVLMSGFYIVPLFHSPEQWVARWNGVQHPGKTSLYGFLPETWWRQPAIR